MKASNWSSDESRGGGAGECAFSLSTFLLIHTEVNLVKNDIYYCEDYSNFLVMLCKGNKFI